MNFCVNLLRKHLKAAIFILAKKFTEMSKKNLGNAEMCVAKSDCHFL